MPDCVAPLLCAVCCCVLQERASIRQAANHEEVIANQHSILQRLPKPPTKLAQVPKGTPIRKSWYVERSHVMGTVLDALTGDGGPCLVGLVGDSGSGKTTAASLIVRSTKVRETFSDGIIWLSINADVQESLPSLMLRLACMVYEDIGGGVGHRPAAPDDGAAYIKQRLEKDRSGQRLTCLLVADNVWEQEVVSKLLETGMWVLLSTRDEELVIEGNGKAVGVDELSKADAHSLLRRAAELPPELRLPDDAADLVELCGRMAMDLAFVGRWSIVRGRQDRTAWSNAAAKVRAEKAKIEDEPETDIAEKDGSKWRKAILRAGFEDLAIGSDDERVQRLYLSLGVLPDGHAFTVKDAAVLLYDGTPSSEDEAPVAGVVEILERWTIINSEAGTYRMHDAHSSFARESLADHGYVRRPAVKRWTIFISSLAALRYFDRYVMMDLWLAVERVGGGSWETTRPYAKELGAMDESEPLMLRQSIEAVAYFQEAQEDWEGARAQWRHLLEVEERELGPDHPFVLNTFSSLANCAERLGDVEAAAKWREKERDGLPMALTRVELQLADGLKTADDAGSLASLAITILTLAPDDRAEAEALLRRSLAIQESKLDREHVLLAFTLQELGVCLQRVGRLTEAEGLLRRCLTVKETKLKLEGEQVAETLHQLGACVREAGRPVEAEELLRRCLVMQEAATRNRDVKVASTLHELGTCILETRQLMEAEGMLKRCLGIRESKLGLQDVQVASTLHNLGVCALEAGRLDEAEKLFGRCLAIREASLGLRDVGVADTLYELGVCFLEVQRPEEAEDSLERCLGIREAKLGRSHVRVACVLHQLGVCYREVGLPQEAEECWRRCLGIWEANLGAQNLLRRAKTLHELGMCVRETGRLTEAEKLLRSCLEIEETELGQEHMDVTVTLYNLGVCLRMSGRLEEAEKVLRRCLGIEKATLSPEEANVTETLNELGACLREAGKLEAADELLRC